jgi:high-affinity K+ transport system ATPase subunit B
MGRFLAVCLVLACCLPALAVQDGQVMYTGGTVAGLKAGVMGRLDMTSDTNLIFDYSGSQLAIPYAAIESYEYSRDVTHHLGVLPAIGVGLIRVRQHQHFFQISYREDNGVSQVVIFEVSKQAPRSLNAVLRERAPRACFVSATCGARH